MVWDSLNRYGFFVTLNKGPTFLKRRPSCGYGRGIGGSIKKRKLGFLQFLCSELELDVSEPPIRKKATYLALLELEVVERVQLH